MWKSLLDALLKSCIAMDPVAYMYWHAAQRESPPYEPQPEARPRREKKVISLESRWDIAL